MLRSAFDKQVRDQRQDVVRPVAQRRHVDVHDVEAIEQVLAEPPGGHGLGEVPVGGRDDADVDSCASAVGADRLDFAVLEEAQEERLHPQAHLADFVEEDRAVVRQLQLAHVVAHRVGERRP